jgi:hypothetical protein
MSGFGEPGTSTGLSGVLPDNALWERFLVLLEGCGEEGRSGAFGWMDEGRWRGGVVVFGVVRICVSRLGARS